MTSGENEAVSQVLHGLSQPVTALEIGLEIGLMQDRTVEDFRKRLERLLHIARNLHGKIVELRQCGTGIMLL